MVCGRGEQIAVLTDEFVEQHIKFLGLCISYRKRTNAGVLPARRYGAL